MKKKLNIIGDAIFIVSIFILFWASLWIFA